MVHLRGVDYSGRAGDTQIRLPWPSGGPAVLWRQKIGEGFSGSVLVGERIFTQMQTLAGQFVVCLDARDGRERWRTRTNWPWQFEGTWPGPYSTPTYADGRVYFADCFGHVGCLDAETGRVCWSVDLVQKFDAKLPGFGYAATPLVDRGKVFLPAGGKGRAVVALNAADGSLAWRAGDGNASYSSCVMVSVAGGPRVLTFLENGPLALDPATGREQWRHRWSRNSDHNGTWPLYAEPYLFYGLPFQHGAEVHRLTHSGGGLQAELAWSSPVLSLDILSGVVVDGHVYAFDVHDFESATEGQTRGVLKCVELATGRERWRSGRTGHCSVIAAGPHLVMLTETGELIVAEASPVAYREVARGAMFPGRRCWTALTIANGLLLARSGDELVAVSLAAEVAPAGTAGGPAQTWWSQISSWSRGHYSTSWFAPTWPDQARWFVACVFGVLMPVGIVALFLSANRLAAWCAWFAGALLLALGATFLLTMWRDQFLLTWPVGIFLGLSGVVACRTWARARPTSARIRIARIALLAFGCSLAGYWLVCRSLFLMAGVGYLVGLLPALPLMVFAEAARRRGAVWRAASWTVSGFSLFFWSAALFVWWRTQA